MRYAMFKLVERQREETYKIYVTDHLKALVNSKARWIDIITPKPDIDADEIAADIISRAGLVTE